MRSQTLSTIGPAALAALLVAACSGDDGRTAAPGPAANDEVPAPAADEDPAAATGEGPAAAVDEADLPSEEEAERRAAQAIDEENADAEFEKLKAEIEADG